MLDFRNDLDRAKYYVSSSIIFVFNLLNDYLDRKTNKSINLSSKHNCLVSFGLFVIRCLHYQTDIKAYGYLKEAIDDYLQGNTVLIGNNGMLTYKNEVSYLTNFGETPFVNDKEEIDTLIDETKRGYNIFVKIWNENYNNKPYNHVEDYLGAILNLSSYVDSIRGCFFVVSEQYSLEGNNDTVKLYNCRRASEDKPRFYQKKIEGFILD